MPLKKKFRPESIAKARIDIGKDDIDDAYMDVNYAISRDTNYTLKEFKKESMSTKQLLEAANRKCEMRWKVLAFNPAEDNKLVKEFKDFDCIDCAVAKKREYLEKNPTHIVEVISESKAQKNEDLSSKIKSLFKDKESEIDSTGKYNGRIKALDDYSYAVWLRGNDAEYDSQVAKFLRTKGFTVDNKFHFLPFERGAKVYILESAQKNEEVTKSNYKSIINELESIFKKFAGNGLELGHKIKPNSFDLPFDTSLSVALKDKAKLEPVKAALKKVIDKYGAKKVAHDNDFAYNFGKSNRDGIYVGFNWNATSAFVGYAVNPDFDVKALSESSQKNEDLVKDKAYTVKKDFAFDYASEYSPSDLAKMKSSGYFYVKGDDLYVKKGAKAKYLGKDKSPQGIEFVSIQNFTVALPEDVLSRTSNFFESAQMNETRGYKVLVELGVPDNMNNRDIEDEVERLLRTSNKINVVIDVTAERK